MSNIVISGYYGSKNAGDEAMLSAMLEVFSELDPKLNITVISSDPEYTKQRHGVDAVNWLNVSDILTALRHADLLISGGGSLLQNVTSGRSLYYYMGILFLSKLVGTPIMLYAQGIGPIYGRFARRLMRWFGNHSSLITVRDKDSLTELATLKITKPPIKATADPVLAIKSVDKKIGQYIFQCARVSLTKPIIGISVREWREWTHYKQVLAQVADKAVEELGAQIVFMPMQYPEDVETAKKVVKQMKSPAHILKEDFTTAQLMSLVGNMDLMIGIRLHALIFAGVMGTPMIGISYDPKIDRFLKSIDEEIVGDLQTITVNSVMEQIRAKWNNKEAYRKANLERMKELRELAKSNAEMALNFIETKA